MNKIVITEDSGLNPIDQDYMIPGLIIDSENQEYYDQKSMDEKVSSIHMEEIFRGFEEGKKYTTSAPKRIDYEKTFESLLEEGYDILHLSISENVSSSSYNSSMSIIKELQEKYQNRIVGVHTQTAGSGGTILCSYAQSLLKEKISLLELKEKIEKLKTKVIGSHFISSCKGYLRSGRMPAGFKVADILGLRYRVDCNPDGKLVPTRIYRGKIKKQALKYIEELVNKNNVQNYDPFGIALLHTPLREIEYKTIVEYLKSLKYFNQIYESPFYGTISAYGVEDQLGLGLIKK